MGTWKYSRTENVRMETWELTSAVSRCTSSAALAAAAEDGALVRAVFGAAGDVLCGLVAAAAVE